MKEELAGSRSGSEGVDVEKVDGSDKVGQEYIRGTTHRGRLRD